MIKWSLSSFLVHYRKSLLNSIVSLSNYCHVLVCYCGRSIKCCWGCFGVWCKNLKSDILVTVLIIPGLFLISGCFPVTNNKIDGFKKCYEIVKYSLHSQSLNCWWLLEYVFISQQLIVFLKLILICMLITFKIRSKSFHYYVFILCFLSTIGEIKFVFL